MMMYSKPIPMGGGLDMVTPPLAISPGRMIAGINYEPTQRGYQRMDGYERFDGQTKPSAATYYILNFTTGTAVINTGDTVTGVTSGATGKALLAVVSSGTYGGGNAVGYLVLTNVTGTFVTLENLQVTAVTKSIANGTTTVRGATTDTLDTTYYQLAVTTARALITAVPGSGGTLGACALNGVKYGFRNNAGGTFADMYKSTAAGWVKVSLGFSLNFTLATTGYTPAEGDVITGVISGATATLQRICVNSGVGTWFAGATGYFVFAAKTGTFQAETLNIGANANVATIAGDAVAQTLGASGHFDFVTNNFFGNAGSKRMYGCNGHGRGFEFDGTVFVSIQTGMTTDKPKHVSAYKGQLFFTFAQGSLQNSGVGAPYTWTVVLGANEIAVGEEITGLSQSWVDTMVVFGHNKIKALGGNNVNDFNFTDLTTAAGAHEWTDDQVGGPIYLDDRGVRSVATTQAYGNFEMGTLTRLIAPFFPSRIAAGATATAACVVKAKDQYRLFYSDGWVIICYFSKQNEGGVSQMSPAGMPLATGIPSITLLKLPITVTCACSVDDSSGPDGTDITLIGDSAGFIYEMDKGTSHDGAAVEAYLRLPFFHNGSPRQKKLWKRAALELDCLPSANIYVAAEFSYGDPDSMPVGELGFMVQGGGGYWNEALWNNFYWSQPYVGKATANIEGTGTSVSISVYSNTIWDAPHTIHGVTYGFSMRGVER